MYINYQPYYSCKHEFLLILPIFLKSLSGSCYSEIPELLSGIYFWVRTDVQPLTNV